MGRVGGVVGWHFLRFVNLVPRDLEFSSYDVRYFSNVKSRLLGLLFCFGLLDRVGRFRRGVVYRPGLLFSFVPCNDLGWVFASFSGISLDRRNHKMGIVSAEM